MEIGCGTDIIDVERIKDAILKSEGFLNKVFTEKEIEIGNHKSENTKYEYYAGRFAAKEAIYKALSKKYGNKLWFGEIEILNDTTNLNRPYVNVLNPEVSNMKFTIDVSISHIKEYAIASAVVYM